MDGTHDAIAPSPENGDGSGFPVTDSQHGSLRRKPDPSPFPTTQRRTVLVACCEPMLGEAVERILRQHADEIAPAGLDVRRVHDGRACLQQAGLARPDALVLSSHLDGLSPAEVLRALEVAHPGERIPSVVLSAGHGRDVPADLAATAVVQLPFDNQDLAAVVGRALACST